MLNLHRRRNWLVRVGEKNILFGQQSDIANFAAGVIGNLTRINRSLVDVNEKQQLSQHKSSMKASTEPSWKFVAVPLRPPWKPQWNIHGWPWRSPRSLHGDFQRSSVKTSMGLHDNLRGAPWTSMKVSMESPTIYGVRRQLSFSVEKTPYVNSS